MRWLLIGLLISVGALLFAAGAMARHVLRQRRVRADEPGNAEAILEIEAQRSARAEEALERENLGRMGGS